MIATLRIYGKPLRQFARDSRALTILDAAHPIHMLLLSAGTANSSIKGETSSVTAVLDNRAAQASRYFEVPPIGLAADLIDDAGIIVFAGSISQIDFDSASLRVTVAI